MIRRVLLILLAALAPAAPAPAPAAAPTSRPAGIDDASWQRMLDIDARAADVTDLIAAFEQRKFTAMLKKPLVSTGEIRVRGSSMLWETRRPEPNALQVNEQEVRIYYPAQKTIEVYQIREKLGQLAASPLPRLAALQEHFGFRPLPLSEMKETDTAKFFAVEMAPIDPDLREHVERVRVLLDATRGLIVRLEMLDADGDRTEISFSDIRTNVGLNDAQLRIDATDSVKVTRPLAGLEGEPADPSQGNGK